MKKRTIPLLAMLLVMTMSAYAQISFIKAITEQTTRVYVDPASISRPTGDTFTIAVKVSNVVNLYGIDLQFAWDPTIIEYVSHKKMIPVNTNPGGIMHPPTLPIKDVVDETASIPDAEPGTMYWLAEACMLPAIAFNGTGSAFEMTFQVVGTGSCTLRIIASSLANMMGVPIEHQIVDGTFSNEAPAVHDVAVIGVTPSTSNGYIGDVLSIDVGVKNLGTVAETFDVTANYDGSSIGTKTSGSLGADTTKHLTFNWDTAAVAPGTYTISATAATVPGETSTEDNFYSDGTVTLQQKPPPPTTGETFDIQWTNYSGNPIYPYWGGKYHDGTYPVWKNFTVLYNGDADDRLIYVSVKYPEATPSFKPDKYEIGSVPDGQCWTVTANLADRTIEFMAQEGGIAPGGYAIVSIRFIQGPTAEDCEVGHEFAVTVSEKSTAGQTFYLKEYIDKTAPQVEITFPKATTPGGLGYAFKSIGGSIWVQMPNCTNKNIRWLWINGTASDTCSGINRVEISINGTYMGDAFLSGLIGSRQVTWWWFVDPTVNPRFWKPESWFYVVARAYDNSVNDEETTAPHGLHRRIPMTNYADALRNWFFWIGMEPRIQLQDQPMPRGRLLRWVPGNGRVDINATTGFYPNGNVDIYLESVTGESDLYNIRIRLTTVTADNYGRFYSVIRHLPEVPRMPATTDRWRIRATDIKGNTQSAQFHIIPWITYEDTIGQDGLAVWDTTKEGKVFDDITVYGHGFLPSRQTKWDPYSTAYVEIVYTDVPPLEKWTERRVFNGTSEFNWDNLEWSPRLSEVVLATVSTDANGYWKAQIRIPQSYGGLHAIYARESRFVTDLGMVGPSPRLVRSGWPECTGVDKEEQAVIFDVWPTIAISPGTAITDQYVTITAEGLPLSKYYKLWKNGNPVVSNRDWCLVLDFGPYEQWVFENKRIRNNELDLAWVMETWYPFASYTPDIADHLDSPVWKGKLTSVTTEFTSEEPKLQFHIGSKFLKVPMLPANNYPVTLYYFDKNTESYVRDYDATTTVMVLKDPLNVHIEVGSVHFPGEIVDTFIQTDVDGIPADVNTLTIELYKGATPVKTLAFSRLDIGVYTASFVCPPNEGDYFIKTTVAKDYETFTLYGAATAAFTMSATLNGFNARLIALEEKVAILITDVGELRFNISEINAKVVSIDGKLVKLSSDVGMLSTSVAAINAKVVAIENSTAEIVTDLGPIKVSVSSINAAVVAIEGKTAKIATDLGPINVSVLSINAVISGLHDDVVVVQTAVGKLEAKLKELNGITSIEDDVATIKTDLGELKGKVIRLEGDTATIKTDIGTITTKADSISGNMSSMQGNVGLTPITIGLSLLAALAAIAAAALILRKVYLK
jgi:hypothetical protein